MPRITTPSIGDDDERETLDAPQIFEDDVEREQAHNSADTRDDDDEDSDEISEEIDLDDLSAMEGPDA